MVCIILSFNKIQPFIQTQRERERERERTNKKRKGGQNKEKKSKRERDFRRYRCVRGAEKLVILAASKSPEFSLQILIEGKDEIILCVRV